MGYHLMKKGKIPEWTDYYPRLSLATAKQRKFYKYWLSEFAKGSFIDIDGNLSYVYVYIYSVIEKFLQDKKIDSLTNHLETIDKAYGQYDNIKSHIACWTSDAYLYIKEYDNAWKYMKGRGIYLGDILSIKAQCTDKSIDAEDLISVFRPTYLGLTKFGVDNISKVKILVDRYLEEFHQEHGNNLIEYFIRQFNSQDLTGDDFLQLKNYFADEKDYLHDKDEYFWNQEKYNNRLQEALNDYLNAKMLYNDETDMVVKATKEKYERIKKEKNTRSKFYFAGVPWHPPSITVEAIPGIIQSAIGNEIRRIVRECENTIREEMNIPRIGEGWLRETELYYKLRESLPKEKIIHHGRPSWVSPQHIDIYFPIRNIGIEYQGAQHNKPIEYFGGEKSFKLQQERDQKKANLCKKNGCELLYVCEGYEFNDLKIKINKLIR